MKLKQLAGLVSIALASVAAQANVQTSTSPDLLTTTYTDTFEGGAVEFGNVGWVNAGSDDYLWLGSLGQPDTTTSNPSFLNLTSPSSITVSFWYSSDNLTSTFTLRNSSNPLAFTSAFALLNNPGSNGFKGIDSFYTYTWTGLAPAGHYGLAFSAGSGLLGGDGTLKIDDLKVVVSAPRVDENSSTIPEPESYAMMLAGLGLMGAIARRRKAKQA